MIAAGILTAGAAFAQQGGGTAAKPATAGQQQAQTPPAPLSAADKPNLSYAIGFQIGRASCRERV